MNKELAINLLRGSVLGTNEQLHEAVFMAIRALKAEPKHGRWIVCDDLYKTIDGRVFDGYRECSVCGEMYPYFPEHNYCPNCGARMDGGEE